MNEQTPKPSPQELRANTQEIVGQAFRAAQEADVAEGFTSVRDSTPRIHRLRGGNAGGSYQIERAHDENGNEVESKGVSGVGNGPYSQAVMNTAGVLVRERPNGTTTFRTRGDGDVSVVKRDKEGNVVRSRFEWSGYPKTAQRVIQAAGLEVIESTDKPKAA